MTHFFMFVQGPRLLDCLRRTCLHRMAINGLVSPTYFTFSKQLAQTTLNKPKYPLHTFITSSFAFISTKKIRALKL